MSPPASGEVKTLANSTLQFLNRWTECSTGKWYHPADVYAKDVNRWDNCPIVLGKVHPDAKLFKTDRDRALEAVGGKIIGHISSPRIEWEGHPRLMSALNIYTSLPLGQKAIDLYNEGKFGISAAEMFDARGNVVAGNLDPSHVLVFEEDELTVPADMGAVAANTNLNFSFSNAPVLQEQPVAANTSDLKPLLTSILDAIKGLINPGSISEVPGIAANIEDKMTDAIIPDPQVSALNQKIGALEQEKAALNLAVEATKADCEAANTSKAEIAAELALKNVRVAELENLELERETARKDELFTTFLNEHVPPGEYATEEAKAALKDTFLNKPYELAPKMLAWAANQAKLPEKAGTKHVAAHTDAPKAADWAGLFHKGGK